MVNCTVLCGEMLKHTNLSKAMFNMANMVYLYGTLISIYFFIFNARYQVPVFIPCRSYLFVMANKN
jgi:hypothetical protein